MPRAWDMQRKIDAAPKGKPDANRYPTVPIHAQAVKGGGELGNVAEEKCTGPAPTLTFRAKVFGAGASTGAGELLEELRNVPS